MRSSAARLVFALLCSLMSRPRPSAAATPQSPESVRTPVLFELFTSEGCSSCPRADSLLLSLEERQPFSGIEVVPVAFHVTYWNDLGWKDPYAAAASDARQYDYSENVFHGSMYTPQLVLGGSESFVPQTDRIAEALEKNRKQSRGAVEIREVKLGMSGRKGAAIRGRIAVLNPVAQEHDADVWLVVTEKGLSTAVPRGENRGRKLKHPPVARKLVKVGRIARGAQDASFGFQVPFDGGWKRDNVALVAFVQSRDTRHVTAVRRLALTDGVRAGDAKRMGRYSATSPEGPAHGKASVRSTLRRPLEDARQR